MTVLDGSARPRLSRGVRLRDDPARGRTVLLAPERVLDASPTAVAVLRRCDGEASVDAIVDALAASYAADPDRIAADVRELLYDLATRRVIEL